MENESWYVQVELTIKGPKEPAQIGKYVYPGASKDLALAVETALKNLDKGITASLGNK
jgi:hypothetical protein